jgi:hypothetical protein
MTSNKGEAFMWTQNFNFKLNVYTMNTEHTHSFWPQPLYLWVGRGAGGFLHIVTISADVVKNQNNQYHAQVQNFSAAPLAL